MRKILNVRICNNCGKEQISEGLTLGNPFYGWLTFHHETILPDEQTRDYCSTKCLVEDVLKE